MWRSLIIFLLTFYSGIAFSQVFKIELIPLRENLTFDSLLSTNNEITITIFYKDDGLKKDCESSRIKENSSASCNLQTFKDKLALLMNNSSYNNDVRIKIYFWKEGEYTITDKLNGKSFNNKRSLVINDLMGFIDMNNVTNEPSIDNHLENLNNLAKQYLLRESGFKISSIFDFSKSIIRKGISNYDCPEQIRVLCKDSLTVYSSNSCPAIDIPLEDMFIEHLTLLFRPNHVLNSFISNNYQFQDTVVKHLDSLKQVVDSQQLKIKTLEDEFLSLKNGLVSEYNVSFLTFNNYFPSSIENHISVNNFETFTIYYSRKLFKTLHFNSFIKSVNFAANLHIDSISYKYQDISSSGIILNRNIVISDLNEFWKSNYAFSLGMGIDFQKSFKFRKGKNEKFQLNLGLNSGKFFPFQISSSLLSGQFSYRASILGINDEIANVSSLELIDDVTYHEEYDQKLLLNGFNLGCHLKINYALLRDLFFSGIIDFSYYKFNNINYNPDTLISSKLGEFNSALYNLKSFTFMPFSIGAGIGFNF